MVGGVSLELPAVLVEGDDRALDSAAAVFEGPGLSVILDQGPFADPLETYVGRPGYEEGLREVAGSTARVVSFRTPEDGTYTVAAHVPRPKPLSVVVRADTSVPEHVPGDIIESVQPLG